MINSFWYKQKEHREADPWIIGPFVYEIGDTVRLDEPIALNGQLGKWMPSNSIYEQLMKQSSIQIKLAEWKQQYGTKLYFGEQGIPSAITIQQPFAEAILCGVKKYENRKRSLFPLHPEFKRSPPVPDITECRFCPDGDAKCTHWVHVSAKTT